MIIRKNIASSERTQWVKSLQGRLRICDGTWQRCNCLKGNDHSAQLRLALRHHSRTLYPVQPRILG